MGKHVHLTGSGRYLYLEFDYALRTRKQILALTLKETSKKIVPQSLLDLKRKTVFPKGQKSNFNLLKTFTNVGTFLLFKRLVCIFFVA